MLSIAVFLMCRAFLFMMLDDSGPEIATGVVCEGCMAPFTILILILEHINTH